MTDGFGLDEPEALDPVRAGAKAAALARLRAAGFPALDGLVLPAGAPAGAVEPFAHRVARRWTEPLAVRSSSAWEDHRTSAHAGESLTILHVRGAGAVAEAVHRCRGAAAAPGMAPGDIAVLVQPMLVPSHAGAAFTADPMTGEREVVRITATEGVADALLGGAVTGIDVTFRSDQVHGELGTLSPADVRAVADVARGIERHLGEPQDVEWAIVDGMVHVLQARPISVLPVPPELPVGNGWQKDVAHYSEPITPFGWWALQRVNAVTAEVFAEAGALVDGLQEQLVGGEVYGRVSPAVGPSDPGRMPPPPASVLGLVARLVPTLRARTRAATRLLEGGLADRWISEWVERDRATFLQAAERGREVDLGSLDDPALVAELRAIAGRLVEGGRSHFRVVIPYFLALHDLHRLVADHVPGWTPTDTGDLLAGSSPATRAAEEALAAIRDRVSTVDGLGAALRGRPHEPVAVLAEAAPELADELGRWLASHGWRALNYDAGSAVLAEKPALVTRLLLAATTAGTDERGRAEQVRADLPDTARDAFDHALARARVCNPLREDTAIVAGDVLLGLLRRWILEVGGRLAARGILGSPRDASYLTGEEAGAALLGTASIDEARALVVRRRGEEAWARAHPGPLTIGHQGPPPDLSRVPTPLRRVNEAMLWAIALEYPAGSDPSIDPPATDGVVAVGVPASPGVGEGAVRIVRDHRDLARLQDGEVLVCRVASPAWVPVFALCAGLVADGGGALSHAAIAAREHGVPAVLGCGRATSTLRDGQMVRVDGKAGSVMLIDT